VRTVAVGKTYTLKPTISPSNAANQEIIWKSDNTKAATVNKNGVVKGIKEGKATITATTVDGAKVATCTVYVGKAVTGVKLNKPTLSLNVGGTSTLKATLVPSDAENKTLTWASSDKKIATVSSKGVVTAVKKGTATITVTTQDGKKMATCVVKVK